MPTRNEIKERLASPGPRNGVGVRSAPMMRLQSCSAVTAAMRRMRPLGSEVGDNRLLNKSGHCVCSTVPPRGSCGG
jgi:hypothetical protein